MTTPIEYSHPPNLPEMVYVPPGPFLMGTSDRQIDQLAALDDTARKWREEGFFSREQPQHRLSLPGFYISKYPVTVMAYRTFISSGGYREGAYWTEAGWSWREAVGRVQPDFWEDEIWAGEEGLPVVGVSWYEAMAYCRRLGQVKGVNCRLPTEAEWEKAARGTDGRLYPWGEVFRMGLANTREVGLAQTEPVGSRPGGDSPYGCGEMGGNTSDWTLSQYLPYPYVGDDGREDPCYMHAGGENSPGGEALRVIRGGSWFKPGLRARVSARGMNDPFFSDHDVGFRYVIEELDTPGREEW